MFARSYYALLPWWRSEW